MLLLCFFSSSLWLVALPSSQTMCRRMSFSPSSCFLCLYLAKRLLISYVKEATIESQMGHPNIYIYLWDKGTEKKNCTGIRRWWENTSLDSQSMRCRAHKHDYRIQFHLFRIHCYFRINFIISVFDSISPILYGNHLFSSVWYCFYFFFYFFCFKYTQCV